MTLLETHALAAPVEVLVVKVDLDPQPAQHVKVGVPVRAGVTPDLDDRHTTMLSKVQGA